MTDSKQLSKERFGQYAEGYITSKTHAKGYDLDRLLELANPQKTWRVLDVATGGGHTALKFAPHVAEVIATDLTPRMLEKAQEFITAQGASNVTFELVDAENIPYVDKTFDLVTCRIAPHHFPHVADFINGAARVLKDGGLLLVQDQVLPEDRATGAVVDSFEKLRDPSHHRVLTESEWRTLFENAGLTVEHTEQLVKHHDFLHWAKMQNCDAATIAKLIAMVETSTDAVKAWMLPTAWGTDAATFANHHLIIAGRKSN